MAENSEIDPKILLMTPLPFPPRGKSLVSAHSPIGVGWEGAGNILNLHCTELRNL